MIDKQNIFASAGQQAQGYSASEYVTGMVPNTIAMAEDVNSFGNTMDKDLDAVCKEVANVVTTGVLDKDGGDGAALNAADNTQLLTALRNMPNGFSQTGIMYNGTDSITCPTQNGNTQIVFGGALRIMFNEGGYFGNSASKMHIGTIAANTVWTITNSVPTGVVFLYAQMSGGAVSIEYQQTPLAGEYANNKCFLGSLFVIDNSGTRQIQTGSWKFQPWLQNTPAIDRESPTAQTKGGLVTPSSGRALNIGPIDIKAEGINFDDGSHQKPNIKKIAAGTFSYKFLYPGYNPANAAQTNLDTTHLYNLTSGTWVDVSGQAGKYMVMVPCVVPTGQTLLIPAMSYYTNGQYANLFKTIEDAIAGLYNLPYTSTDTDKTRARAIYLGYSMIVKIGATDLTDLTNFTVTGLIPQALSGFDYAGGQTGGSTGTYIPMPTYTWNTTELTLKPNCKNVVTGRAGAQVNISFPQPNNNVVQEIYVEYEHQSNYGGLNFVTPGPQPWNWWNDTTPTWLPGRLYLFRFVRSGGAWMGTQLRQNTTAYTLTGNYVAPITMQNFAVQDNSNPGAQVETEIAMLAGTNNVNNYLGSVTFRQQTDGWHAAGLRVGNSVSGTYKEARIEARVKSDGTQTTYAPTPPTTDNTTSIATTAFVKSVLGVLYPVGSVYIGTQSTCPLATLIPGSTWVKVEGRYLLASGTLAETSESYSATNTVNAGAPNITGQFCATRGGVADNFVNNAFSVGGQVDTSNPWDGRGLGATWVDFSAENSNNKYGKSATIRPAAYVVNVWRRTA